MGKVKLANIEKRRGDARHPVYVFITKEERDALCKAVRAAKEYETYLPNMEVFGAAGFSGQLRAAMALRGTLAAFEWE